MQFIMTPTWDAGIAAITDRLTAELRAGSHVLWLVPGGSAIKAVCTIIADIPDELTDHLTITLSDERFGPLGHPDSNWQQLSEQGFDPKKAMALPVLTSGTDTIEAAVGHFEDTLARALSTNDTVIAQLGMGPDGHVAGILPDSPATAAPGLVAGYQSETFARVTTTFAALEQATAAYVLAFGAEKKPALERLQTDVPLPEQPAQVLKLMPEAYVYNDQIGDTV